MRHLSTCMRHVAMLIIFSRRVLIRAVPVYLCTAYMCRYRIAGNFRGIQFSRMVSLQSFLRFNFHGCERSCPFTLYMYMYNHTYFTGLIFADSRLSTKTAKIGPHENFPLYGFGALTIDNYSIVQEAMFSALSL
jgi:hypothetical protein